MLCPSPQTGICVFWQPCCQMACWDKTRASGVLPGVPNPHLKRAPRSKVKSLQETWAGVGQLQLEIEWWLEAGWMQSRASCELGWG